MTAHIDTDVFVRHLTGDPPALSRRATAFLSRAEELVLADLIVAEVVCVLESVYGLPPVETALRVRAILGFPPVVTADKGRLLRAVDLYETARLHFAEAYLVACAEASGVGAVASFDRSIDRVVTVQRVEP
ncbi:MAG TPA: PIN domain-containing protein [Egibacteraceae bacterium]|nr:PIN domain-containing protein [Egibacteraceae bacterium]